MAFPVLSCSIASKMMSSGAPRYPTIRLGRNRSSRDIVDVRIDSLDMPDMSTAMSLLSDMDRDILDSHAGRHYSQVH